MARSASPILIRAARPSPAAVLELLKPITWFPPMWAFACGLVSAGLVLPRDGALALGGIVLAGPLLCGASQAVNDWFDRDVDALNEPGRPIPSGRIPGVWGLGLAIGTTALALLAALAFGRWVFVPAGLGCLLSWAYSAPPVRLKRDGWWGNAAVALSYEGLAWLAGAAVISEHMPDGRTLALALLYSLGSHGIMTLNDFKSVEGDRRAGVRSLPVQLGAAGAARAACVVILLAQAGVVGCLFAWGRPFFAIAVLILGFAQAGLMPRFLRDPRGEAARYNATGTGLFVLGMMVAAFALRGLGGVA